MEQCVELRNYSRSILMCSRVPSTSQMAIHGVTEQLNALILLMTCQTHVRLPQTALLDFIDNEQT